MAQNVTVAGASYSDVPAVVLPKTGGGSATFTDVSDTTAAASDVASGKYFYTAAGVKTAGTGSGSGSDFVVSLSKNNQTGYWEPNETWSEVSAAIADNKTFVFCIAGMTENSELAADGVVYNGHLQYLVYETLQDQSNNYYTDERWYSFDSTGVTEDYAYIYYDTAYADAQASDILSGKTAFNSSGSVSGSIPTKTSSDLTANNLTVTAPSGYYASPASKTLTDANLVAGNIKKDVTIFGVTGTYEGGGGSGFTVKTGTYTFASNYTVYKSNATSWTSGAVIIATGLTDLKCISFISEEVLNRSGTPARPFVGTGIWTRGSDPTKTNYLNNSKGIDGGQCITSNNWNGTNIYGSKVISTHEMNPNNCPAGSFALFAYNSSYYFKAGQKITWEAIGTL